MAHVGDELALGPVGGLGGLPRGFEAGLGLSLLCDVGVNADPFPDLPRSLLDDRDGPDGEIGVAAVPAAHAVFEDEGPPGRDGLVPGGHRRSRVFGMDGLGPAETLVGLEALSRQGAPARLFAVHAAVGAVGPQHALDRRDGGTETLVRAAQPGFHGPALPDLGLKGPEQPRIVDRHGGLGREPDDEALVAFGEAAGLGMAEQQRAGDAGGTRTTAQAM